MVLSCFTVINQSPYRASGFDAINVMKFMILLSNNLVYCVKRKDKTMKENKDENKTRTHLFTLAKRKHVKKTKGKMQIVMT